MPSHAWVHRARFVGPRGRRPADELHGTAGPRALRAQAQLFGRRLLVPDENVSWNLTAIPAALRIVRDEGIDVVITTSPPGSVHFVGAACKRATGVRWVADLRDSLVAHPHRDAQRLVVRAKEQRPPDGRAADRPQADAIVGVSDAISEEMRALEPRGPVVTIANGSDFDDFAGLEYTRSRPPSASRTRGRFFGKRDPQPFLTALARVDGVVARFVGDFRATDREWAGGHRRPDRADPVRAAPPLARAAARLGGAAAADPRGRRPRPGRLSGKVFEYLAAERPILALVPPDGAAAELLRDTGAGVVVAPEDIDGIARELTAMPRPLARGRARAAGALGRVAAQGRRAARASRSWPSSCSGSLA